MTCSSLWFFEALKLPKRAFVSSYFGQFGWLSVRFEGVQGLMCSRNLKITGAAGGCLDVARHLDTCSANTIVASSSRD